MEGKVNLIMPMAGEGSRFNEKGFELPKPMLTIEKKPFFYWSAMSVLSTMFVEQLIFVVLEEHCKKYHLHERIYDFFPGAIVKVIPNILPGAVHTAMVGVKEIDNQNMIIINDCDHMFQSKKLMDFVSDGKTVEGGGLTFFESDNPNYSYIKYDNNKNIQGTVEKNPVSQHAICGAYIFRNRNIFEKYAKQYVEVCPYTECYISGIYNLMINDGLKISEFILDWHLEFGTPKEYEDALRSSYFSDFNSLTKTSHTRMVC